LAARFRNARPGVPRSAIHADKAGLTVTVFNANGSETKTELKWNEVNVVVVYKRDCYGADLLCMGFTTSGGVVEVNEEMEGWAAMTDALPSYLPGVPPTADWWTKVTQPPFATNLITLFSSK
jgi:hypothetical protein